VGRRSLALAVFVLAFGLLAQSAVALVPAGPRLAVSKLGPGGGGKIYTLGPDASQRRTLLTGSTKKLPLPFGKVAWAPDGSRLAVVGISAAKPGRSGYPTQIFLVPADGGEPQPLSGTRDGSNPVFSPDGHTIAFAKQKVTLELNKKDELVYQSVSIWLLDLQTGTTRRITPWRNRLVQIPSSFSPDGSVLAFTRYVADKRPEAIGINFDGSAASVLVSGSAIEPVFSPDGSRIAFLRGPTREVVRHRKYRGGGSSTTRWSVRLTDLYTTRYGGGELRRLTKTPKLGESEPSWDPSGQRLAYMEASPLASQMAAAGFGARLRAINADGTCVTDLLHFPNAMLYGPAWQPGPGREAGPISC
jgi:Tol biopolymer transport system component